MGPLYFATIARMSLYVGVVTIGEHICISILLCQHLDITNNEDTDWRIMGAFQWRRFGVYSVNIHLIDSSFDVRRRSLDSTGVTTGSKSPNNLTLKAI